MPMLRISLGRFRFYCYTYSIAATFGRDFHVGKRFFAVSLP